MTYLSKSSIISCELLDIVCSLEYKKVVNDEYYFLGKERVGERLRATFVDDFRPDSLAREDFEQDRVAESSVDDVDLFDAAFNRFEARLNFGDHTADDSA